MQNQSPTISKLLLHLRTWENFIIFLWTTVNLSIDN